MVTNSLHKTCAEIALYRYKCDLTVYLPNANILILM